MSGFMEATAAATGYRMSAMYVTVVANTLFFT